MDVMATNVSLRFHFGKKVGTPRQFSQEWQTKDLEHTELGRANEVPPTPLACCMNIKTKDLQIWQCVID